MTAAAEGERSREVLRVPAFALFWSATTIRAFGTTIAGVAFQVLIVTVLDATPFEISVLSALGVVPYLFLGLIIGALIDRWRRQRTLIVTSVGRAIVLACIPALLLLDALSFWSLAVVILALGVLTLFMSSGLVEVPKDTDSLPAPVSRPRRQRTCTTSTRRLAWCVMTTSSWVPMPATKARRGDLRSLAMMSSDAYMHGRKKAAPATLPSAWM